MNQHPPTREPEPGEFRVSCSSGAPISTAGMPAFMLPANWTKGGPMHETFDDMRRRIVRETEEFLEARLPHICRRAIGDEELEAPESSGKGSPQPPTTPRNRYSFGRCMNMLVVSPNRSRQAGVQCNHP